MTLLIYDKNICEDKNTVFYKTKDTDIELLRGYVWTNVLIHKEWLKQNKEQYERVILPAMLRNQVNLVVLK